MAPFFSVRVTIAFIVMLSLDSCRLTSQDERLKLAEEIEKSIQTEMLNKWYPQSVDKQYGGFLSTFAYDWTPISVQDKMIVTQARHLWTNAKAFEIYPDTVHYKHSALHGLHFLRDVMWDKTDGGFHTLVDRKGNVKSELKTAYGNAFGIYGLAACYRATHDTSALNLAKKTFLWLERASHDSIFKGYFQHLDKTGSPLKRGITTPSTSDLGYKDQNSSIHLLEAFTELYQVWPDSLVGARLKEMLYLIRDTIVTKKGYMMLFFQPDWTPVSFSDSSEAYIAAHHGLDHVSFGHDVEIAYLMLEASHVLGLTNDTTTWRIAKAVTDHAIRNGWDSKVGGFYDEGYYFKDRDTLVITHDTKNWWAQAEGLNTLLLMADYFPNDTMEYYKKFELQWDYIKRYVIDHEHGDWYPGGLDKEPNQKTGLKGHTWKACYHQFRALSNCVQRLKSNDQKQGDHGAAE